MAHRKTVLWLMLLVFPAMTTTATMAQPVTAGDSVAVAATAAGLTVAEWEQVRPSFFTYCPAPANGNQTFPFPIMTADFCGSVGLTDRANKQRACPVYNLLSSLLGSPRSNPIACRIAGREQLPKPVDNAGRTLPQVLSDRRSPRTGSIPAVLPTAQVLASEGGTLLWLYKMLLSLAGWSPCAALGESAAFQYPPGWSPLGELTLPQDLSEYNLAAKGLPLGALMRKDDHLLLLLRGTLTAQEYKLDLDYRLLRNATYGPGQLHQGFVTVANQVWSGGLQALLDSQFGISAGQGAAAAASPPRSITVAGHSLGGAVGQLLAARMQVYLARNLAGRPEWAGMPAGTPTVSAALFGSPNVGDTAFVTHLNKRINLRNVQYENDLISQVPCTPRMLSCAGSGSVLPYASAGGRVKLTAANMPVQQSVWERLSRYDQSTLCSHLGSVGSLSQATHICSFMCALSTTVPGDTYNWCLLWPASGGEAGAGNACLGGYGGFPTTPQFPPAK